MKLSELIKQKEITLPSGIVATIREGIPGGEADKLDEMIEDRVVFKYAMVEKILVKWNLTDDEDKVLPIDSDNLKKLPLDDLLFVLNYGRTEKK
jgi:hypothetical protein